MEFGVLPPSPFQGCVLDLSPQFDINSLHLDLMNTSWHSQFSFLNSKEKALLAVS